MSRSLTQALVALLGIFGNACTAGSTPAIDADAAPHDAGGQTSVDIDDTPRLWLSSVTPPHLVTNLPPSVMVRIRAYPKFLDRASAEQVLKAAVTLVSLPKRAPIPLDYSSQGGSGETDFLANFKASSTLQEDVDYLLRIEPSANLEVSRELTMFRVGSLPRVRRITFQPAGFKVASVVIDFSEQIDPGTAAQSILLSHVGGKPIATSLVPPGTPSSAVFVSLVAPQDAMTPLRIAIGADVGSPKRLDGQYTGVEGSPFEITLVPREHAPKLGGTDWEPTLTF